MGPQVREALHLAGGEVARVELGPRREAPARLRTVVPIEGVEHTLDLVAHSVRSPLFTVMIQETDGSLTELPAGPVRTMRGTVEGIPGSAVAASIRDDGLAAMILMPDGMRYWIEPIGLRVWGAAATDHVVYHDADVGAFGGTCGVVADEEPADGVIGSDAEGSIAGNTLIYAELAVDADTDYVNDFLTPEAAQEQIESIVNTVNLQYERDLGQTHALTRIVLRTSEPDPYTQTNASFLLDEFKEEWETVQRNVPRDVAHLFTGKNLDGTVIGVAWRGGNFASGDTVCGEYGYSVVESNCLGCSNVAAKTDLTAHELGHNWGADHCDCNGWTMYASLQSANKFHATFSIPEMAAFRDTRTCLDVGDDLRRLILSAETKAIPESEPVQFTAMADFRFAGSQDVTDETMWEVDPPTAGTIDPNGVFTPAAVTDPTCATVSAAYTFDGVTRSSDLLVTILDGDGPLAVTMTDPPTGAIDARLPVDPVTFLPLGWRTVEVGLTDELCAVVPADFIVAQEGGSGIAPNVTAVEHVGPATYRLTLNRALEPGTWTDITHSDSGTTVRLGFLPGDADQNGRVDTDDVFALVDMLYGSLSLPPYAADADRSGETLPVDLLALVELLRGTGTLPGWLGASLP